MNETACSIPCSLLTASGHLCAGSAPAPSNLAATSPRSTSSVTSSRFRPSPPAVLDPPLLACFVSAKTSPLLHLKASPSLPDFAAGVKPPSCASPVRRRLLHRPCSSSSRAPRRRSSSATTSAPREPLLPRAPSSPRSSKPPLFATLDAAIRAPEADAVQGPDDLAVLAFSAVPASAPPEPRRKQQQPPRFLELP